MTEDERISSNILEYRKKGDVSEMDMATQMGMPFTFYRVFEQTPSKFDVKMLEKAASILGCTVDDLKA